MNSNKLPVLLISHDIGGAQLVASFAKSKLGSPVYVLAEGPAIRAYQEFFESEVFIDRARAMELLSIKAVESVLTSTSWESALELDFIQIAKRSGIKVTTYLDHWVNFRERFGFPETNWQENLPHELWAHDQKSLELVREFFPEIPSYNKGNSYIESKLLNSSQKTEMLKNSFLILTEPISEHQGDRLGYNEFDAIELLLAKVRKLAAGEAFKVTLRPHPSERNYYKEKYARYLSGSFTYSVNDDLFADIGSHEYIVGCETIAMYYASLLDRKILCSIPTGDDVALPISKITYLRDV